VFREQGKKGINVAKRVDKFELDVDMLASLIRRLYIEKRRLGQH